MAARKQKELPGVENPNSIKELDDAAEAYNDLMRKRVKLSAKEKVAKDVLTAAMKKHNLLSYTDTTAVPPISVQLSAGKDKVKVELLDDVADEDEEVDGVH